MFGDKICPEPGRAELAPVPYVVEFGQGCSSGLRYSAEYLATKWSKNKTLIRELIVKLCANRKGCEIHSRCICRQLKKEQNRASMN
jgi:hypothetical protein